MAENLGSNPFLKRVRSFVTHEQAYGTAIDLSTIAEHVSGLPKDYVVRAVSACLVLIDLLGTPGRSQRLLAPKLFPPRLPTLGPVDEVARRGILVHRPQLLGLLNLSLRGDSHAANITSEERQDRLAHALLGLSSLLYEVGEPIGKYRTRGMKPLSNTIRTNDWESLDEDGRHLLMDFVYAYQGAMYTDLNHVLARYGDMFLNTPHSESFATTTESRTLLADRLLHSTKLRLEQYVAMVFGVLAHFLSVESLFESPDSFPIVGSTFFSNGQLDETLVSSFFEALTLRPTAFLQRGEDASCRSSIFDVEPFLTHPFICLPETDTYWPLGLKPMVELLNSGLFWKAVTTEPGVYESLRAYWGELFQEYCLTLCRRMASTSWRAVRLFAPDSFIWQGERPGRSCDAILVQPPTALLLEFKSKQPSLRQTLQARSYTAFHRDIDELLIGGEDRDKAAAQLDSTVQALESGGLALPGLTPGELRFYVPIVVTPQEWPMGPFVYEYVRHVVQRNGWLEHSKCLPLELWGCDDLENLQSVLCHHDTATRLDTLLRAKSIPPYGNLPMSAFMRDHYGSTLHLSPQMCRGRDQVFHLVKQVLKLRA